MEYHDARYAVGEFVLHEQSNLHKYTINQIAEYSYTSKATVVRFAKTLGFDGWKEFMKAFISEMKYLEQHKADADVNYPFDAKSSVNEIIDSIKKVQIESIQDSADLLDVEMLEKAVHYLIKAKHIIIFGLSPNIFIGELFRRKMITIKKQVDIAKLGEMGIISNTLTEDDCAIMISYSGNNEHAEPMCYIPTLLENKVSVIGITSGGDNYMRKEFRLCLNRCFIKRKTLYKNIKLLRPKNPCNIFLMCCFPVILRNIIKIIIYINCKIQRFWSQVDGQY